MKFLKYLFTVPKGKKVTESDMKRVLASSICGILLCMTCLFSTTWAWYTVSMETGPVSLQVADHKAVVTAEGGEIPAEVVLQANETKEVSVIFKTDADPTEDGFKNMKAYRYIVAVVHKEAVATEQEAQTEGYTDYVGTYYFEANKVNSGGLNYENLVLTTGANCLVKFSTAWHIPENATVLNACAVGQEIPNRYNFVIIPIEQNAQQTGSQTEQTGADAQTPVAEPERVPVETTVPTEPKETQAPAETTIPAVAPQSSSRTMTLEETSTRRRVR